RRRRHCAHDEPRTRSRIAEIDRILGLGEAAHSTAMNAPCAWAITNDIRTEGPHCICRAQHVIGFEKTLCPCLSDRQRSQDERPMRNGLVAWTPRYSTKRSGAARSQGFCGCVTLHLLAGS